MPALSGARHYTIIIQTVHILQVDSADTGSRPLDHFFKHNPNYFQITQPGNSTVTPPHQWRRPYQWRGRTNGGGLYQWRRHIPMEAAVPMEVAHTNGSRPSVLTETTYELLFIFFPDPLQCSFLQRPNLTNYRGLRAPFPYHLRSL
jgi:hypothetical protein